MEYLVSINWNRNKAFDGTGTAASAYEVWRALTVGQFVNADKCERGRSPLPTLDSILALEKGESLDGWMSDGTGRASWSILAIDRVGTPLVQLIRKG